jgi:protein TonB
MGLEGLGEINLEEDLLMDNDTVMDESSVDSKPQIIAQSPMEFPEKALKANIVNGMVELRLLINKEGEVGQTEILSAEPKGYFEEVALAGVQKWRFTPATYRGRNVAIWATQVVRFGE